jgi:Zn-dependent M28 family amino/carboxypeptidase
MKSFLIAAAFAAAAQAPLPKALGETPIDPARLSEHVQVLASDAFEGRGVASPGEAKTLAYLERQYAALGLEPGGPNGKWTQEVPLNRFETAGPVRLSFDVKGAPRAMTQGQELVVNTVLPVDHARLHKAPLVFVGYGVKAPEKGWDDFKGVDLKGKIAVVLINDPDFEAPENGRFEGKAMTWYGRWMNKYEEAARQGAAGVLIVHETAPASYGWTTVSNTFVIEQFDNEHADPAKMNPLVRGWIQRDVAADLFKQAGLDFEAQKALARSPDFKAVTLDGVRFSADYGVKHQRIVSHNVLARLKGRSRPNETVIYTAHWDHLGIGPTDANGDTIYNGAVDDATGVAAQLELARVFAEGPRPERSIVFLTVTAEEKGLLGSAYYTANPVYPLATTVVDLNMDSLRPAGPTWDVYLTGGSKLSLAADMKAAAERHGRKLVPELGLVSGSFYRSDHFSFAKVGVPAGSLGVGEDLLNGGVEKGRAWRDAFVAKGYHQPDDEWSPDWDLRGLAFDVGLFWEVGRDLANSRRWPEWLDGTEFKGVRDRSALARPEPHRQ